MSFADCLPEEICYVAKVEGLRELRLRNNHPARVNAGGKWFWAGRGALVNSPERAVRLGEVCDTFVKKACNSSVYAYEKMLAQGFFTMADGARVGVCGVMGANGVFQKYTSLCIRVPHCVACVTDEFDGSVIVAGAPRSGKTTYLRDLACKLSRAHNVTVVDERGEIACVGFAEHSCADVFCYVDKRYAFEVAVRSLSPDWLVTDELAENDLPLLQHATASGVHLAASIHASSLPEVKTRLGAYLHCFKYAVLLKKDTFAQTVLKLDEL